MPLASTLSELSATRLFAGIVAGAGAYVPFAGRVSRIPGNADGAVGGNSRALHAGTAAAADAGATGAVGCDRIAGRAVIRTCLALARLCQRSSCREREDAGRSQYYVLHSHFPCG